MVEKWAYFFREAGHLLQLPVELSVPPISKALELARLAGLSRAERESYDRELMAQQDQRGMLSYAQEACFSEGKQLGHTQGKAEGLAAGLREAIWTAAELLEIEKTQERETVLLTQSEAQLKAFLTQLKQSRTWQSDSTPLAQSKRLA